MSNILHNYEFTSPVVHIVWFMSIAKLTDAERVELIRFDADYVQSDLVQSASDHFISQEFQ